MAAALAAPQYGPQPTPSNYGSAVQGQPQFAAPVQSVQQFAPAPQFEQAPIQIQQQAAPQVSADQWASLNPYGSNSNGYPAEERPQIEEIQRQWAKFLE